MDILVYSDEGVSPVSLRQLNIALKQLHQRPALKRTNRHQLIDDLSDNRSPKHIQSCSNMSKLIQ